MAKRAFLSSFFGTYSVDIEERSASAPTAQDVSPAFYPASVSPTRRTQRILTVSTDEAVTHDAVYRAVSILTTLVRSLELQGIRGGKPMVNTPELISNPSLDNSPAAFKELTVASLAIYGESFWLLGREAPGDAFSPVVRIDVEHPSNILIEQDTFGQWSYSRKLLNGRYQKLASHQFKHLKLFRRPGYVRGLGPVHAGQSVLRLAIDLDTYGARWFGENATPKGAYLKTPQIWTNAQAEIVKETTETSAENGGIPVYSGGLEPGSLDITPEEALYTNVIAQVVTRIARLFGIPAAAMDSPSGDSTSYSNLNDRDRYFLRSTLSRYLTEIEEAYSSLLAIGTTAKFNVDALFQFAGVSEGDVSKNPTVSNGEAV